MTKLEATATVAAVLVAGLALAACGPDGESGSVALSTTVTAAPTATTSTAPPPAATTAAVPTVSPTPVVPSAPPTPPSENLTGFQTDPFRREHTVAVPPVPQVTAVRFARHPGFDRVVFDLAGPLPGAVSVRYVDRVVADGSGDPVSLAGVAFLQVRFEGAQAHTDTGAPTISSRTRPGLVVVSEIVLTGDVEGTVSVAFGLTGRTSFRVLELAGPTRVVVDVRAP